LRWLNGRHKSSHWSIRQHARGRYSDGFNWNSQLYAAFYQKEETTIQRRIRHYFPGNYPIITLRTALTWFTAKNPQIRAPMEGALIAACKLDPNAKAMDMRGCLTNTGLSNDAHFSAKTNVEIISARLHSLSR
jgi:hypothetical protein